jgi:hypothetical protein
MPPSKFVLLRTLYGMVFLPPEGISNNEWKLFCAIYVNYRETNEADVFMSRASQIMPSATSSGIIAILDYLLPLYNHSRTKAEDTEIYLALRR